MLQILWQLGSYIGPRVLNVLRFSNGTVAMELARGFLYQLVSFWQILAKLILKKKYPHH